MTNSEIRKKAAHLNKEHGGRLILISFVTALMTFTVSIAAGLLARADMYTLSRIVLFGARVLQYPIVTLGAVYAYFEVWRGKAPSLSMLWRFVSSKENFLNALRLGLLYRLLLELPSIPIYMRRLAVNNAGILMLLGIVALIVLYLALWLIYRFWLIPYLFSLSPEENAPQYFRKSFRRMRGKFCRFAGMIICTMWWRYFAVVFVSYAVMSAIGVRSEDSSVYTDMALLLLSLLMPYPLLALTGFADGLINERLPAEKAVEGFQLVPGVRVPDLTGIHECYEIKDNGEQFIFTANISAGNIINLIECFCAELDEPCFFIIEVPANLEEEQQLRGEGAGPLHCDVYYCDGLSRQSLFELLDKYGELLVNDGMVCFGVASHTTNDELYIGNYKIAKIITSDKEYYQYFMSKMHIPFEESIKTVYDNFSQNKPGKAKIIISGGRSIYDMVEELKESGFYLVERREQ